METKCNLGIRLHEKKVKPEFLMQYNFALKMKANREL